MSTIKLTDTQKEQIEKYLTELFINIVEIKTQSSTSLIEDIKDGIGWADLDTIDRYVDYEPLNSIEELLKGIYNKTILLMTVKEVKEQGLKLQELDADYNEDIPEDTILLIVK